jgi:hypothetical protein
MDGCNLYYMRSEQIVASSISQVIRLCEGGSVCEMQQQLLSGSRIDCTGNSGNVIASSSSGMSSSSESSFFPASFFTSCVS